GEDVPPQALWAGNPATETHVRRAVVSPADGEPEPASLVDRRTPPRRSPHHGTTVAKRAPG
ncbi:hypothetical protein LVX13_38975, partial [Streptomyces albulus]|nr:hypothetical protein [Streptomyces noursei]